MPFINCKVELKFRRTKHCVLSVGDTDNTNANDVDSNIIFLSKIQNYMFL